MFAEEYKEMSSKVFRSMLNARTLEAKLGSLYKAGKIVGGVYLGKGQEAVSASLGAQLRWGKDVFAPLIRDQAGRMAFGEEFLDTTRTYLGSVLGPMKGRDGNIHRGRPQEGLLAMISHLGAAVSQVGGVLLSRRMQGTLGDTIGATCIGDGATSTGAFHEGLNALAVEKLPVIVVVADNQFAYSTPSDRQYACENLLDKAKGYGVDGHKVDGTDLFKCVEMMGRAAQNAKNGKGPQLVVAKLLRLSGHGEHDDASYVPSELFDGAYGRDCLEVAKEQLITRGWMSEENYLQFKKEAEEQTQEAVATAQREPVPDPYKEDWSACATRFH